jgi:hypothetical protein
MRELTKEVVIGEHRYQISRMDAMHGSWIAMQMLTRVFPMNLEDIVRRAAENEGMGQMPSLPANRSTLSEEEFRNVQLHCLRVCSRFEMVGANDVAMPIVMPNGVWAIKDLQTDVLTVLALTAQSLVFNISPFFEEGALNPVLESLSELIPRPAKT